MNIPLSHYRGDTETFAFTHAIEGITKVSFYVRDSIGGTLLVATNSVDDAEAWDIGASVITLELDAPDGPDSATTTSITLTRLVTELVYDVQVETATDTTTIQYGTFSLIGDVVTPAVDGDLPTVFSTLIVDALEAGDAPSTANPFITESALDTAIAGVVVDLSDYYTETEVNTILTGYSQTGHTHNDLYYTESEITALLTGYSLTSHDHAFSAITAKPTTLAGYGIVDAAALVHTHDDRYYTEAEITTLIANFITQAQGDVRYGQLSAAQTWALAQTFTTPIFASSGTAALPGYAFTGVPSSGIFRESAANVGVSTSGTTRGLFSSASLAVFQPFFATITDAVTNVATVVERYDHNSSGTPATGYGSQTVWRLKSSTTSNQDAIAELAYWLTATHASRASAWEIQGVFNAAALAAWLRAGRTGVAGSTALWLYREGTGALEQVLEGVADSGGTGRKALTVAN